MSGDFDSPHIIWQELVYNGVEKSSAYKLLDIMLSFNLNKVVHEYTRITSTAHSLLDLVFLSNNIEEYSCSIEEGISDHKMIVVSFTASITSYKKNANTITTKDYNNADDTAVVDLLELSFSLFEQYENEKKNNRWVVE